MSKQHCKTLVDTIIWEIFGVKSFHAHQTLRKLNTKYFHKVIKCKLNFHSLPRITEKFIRQNFTHEYFWTQKFTVCIKSYWLPWLLTVVRQPPARVWRPIPPLARHGMDMIWLWCQHGPRHVDTCKHGNALHEKMSTYSSQAPKDGRVVLLVAMKGHHAWNAMPSLCSLSSKDCTATRNVTHTHTRVYSGYLIIPTPIIRILDYPNRQIKWNCYHV